MSAVPKPSLSKIDAERIRKELEHLSRQQNKALEMAIDLNMSGPEQKQYDERHQEIVNLLRQLSAVEVGEFSKLSARMIELSLQEGHRTPILRDTGPEEHVEISPSLFSPSTSRIAPPSLEGAGRTETVVRTAVSATTHDRQQTDGTSRAGTNRKFFTSVRRIFSSFRFAAAEHTIIRQRTTWLSEYLSKSSARVRQFVTDRILTTRSYHCRDCGRELGVRSRPRTFVEHFILPLLLMQPVRCIACFRRDYWLIFTPVRERSHTNDHIRRHGLRSLS